jgi:hypothetical protein
MRKQIYMVKNGNRKQIVITCYVKDYIMVWGTKILKQDVRELEEMGIKFRETKERKTRYNTRGYKNIKHQYRVVVKIEDMGKDVGYTYAFAAHKTLKSALKAYKKITQEGIELEAIEELK